MIAVNGGRAECLNTVFSMVFNLVNLIDSHPKLFDCSIYVRSSYVNFSVCHPLLALDLRLILP